MISEFIPPQIFQEYWLNEKNPYGPSDCDWTLPSSYLSHTGDGYNEFLKTAQEDSDNYKYWVQDIEVKDVSGLTWRTFYFTDKAKQWVKSRRDWIDYLA